jgi:hypothetical protein
MQPGYLPMQRLTSDLPHDRGECALCVATGSLCGRNRIERMRNRVVDMNAIVLHLYNLK